MYTVTEEVRVFLEKEDILSMIDNILEDDAFFHLGGELGDNYEGSYQKVEWAKNGEMVVTLS